MCSTAKETDRVALPVVVSTVFKTSCGGKIQEMGWGGRRRCTGQEGGADSLPACIEKVWNQTGLGVNHEQVIQPLRTAFSS